MAETLSGVNGKIIQWAREYYNMSSEEAAQKIGVDVEKYKNWEAGTDHPTCSFFRRHLKSPHQREICELCRIPLSID